MKSVNRNDDCGKSASPGKPSSHSNLHIVRAGVYYLIHLLSKRKTGNTAGIARARAAARANWPSRPSLKTSPGSLVYKNIIGSSARGKAGAPTRAESPSIPLSQKNPHIF